jgi:hypothetical protein
MGLLRKYMGTLQVTPRRCCGPTQHHRAVRHLAARLLPDKPVTFQSAARPASPRLCGNLREGTDAARRGRAALTALGWRYRDGTPLEAHELYGLDALTTLVNIADPGEVEAGKTQLESWVTPAAAALARAALRR